MTTTPTPRLIKYAQALECGDPRYYSRYIRDICRLMPDGGSFLDVGCGTGRVLREIYRRRPDAMMAGVEPVPYFRDLAKQSGAPIFADCSHVIGRFDVVSSFTVLEHCRLPGLHISECADLVRPGGHLILACPNMLSPWSKVMGYSLRNKWDKFRFYSRCDGYMDYVAPRINATFESDDDAVAVTHEIPIRDIFKDYGLRIVASYGTMRPSFIADTLSRIPWVRWAMPSVYMIAKKEK